MQFIINNWKKYFEDRDEGLGTTYERFILHQYFERIKRAYSIKSVLEAPSFGMTGISGINSMWWALHGAEVTIMDDESERLESFEKVWKEAGFSANLIHTSYRYASLPFVNQSFDMSWNFAGIGHVSNLEEFLGEMVRVTRMVIFVCVPNRLSLGFRWQNRGSEGFSWVSENMEPDKILTTMSDLGWTAVQRGYLDCPPWPDIGMKKEDLLRTLGFKKIAMRLEQRKGESKCILEYYKGLNLNMEKEFLKYSFLENFPNWLKRFWAHHRYFVFTRQ